MTLPFYGLLPFFSGAIEKGNSPGWFRPCCCCFAAPRFLLFRIKNRSWKFDVIFDGFLVSIFARLGWWSWVIGRRDWRRDRRRLFCRLRFSVGNGSQSRKMEWNLSPENRKATHTDRQTDNMRWINLIKKKEKPVGYCLHWKLTSLAKNQRDRSSTTLFRIRLNWNSIRFRHYPRPNIKPIISHVSL